MVNFSVFFSVLAIIHGVKTKNERIKCFGAFNYLCFNVNNDIIEKIYWEIMNEYCRKSKKRV